MPHASPKSCVKCGVTVRDGTSRCELHKVKRGSFADRNRGSRHERGYGTEWDKTRERIMTRDAGLCQACMRRGHVTLAYAVDHKVPKFEGGTDDDDNLEGICRSDHKAKTAEEAHRSRRIEMVHRRGGGGSKV